MSDLEKSRKVKAGTQSIEDEIAAAEEKLRKLREKKRDADIKAREKNTKAVLELLRNEKLDMVQSSIWEGALPKIREALFGVDAAKAAVSPPTASASAVARSAAGDAAPSSDSQPATA